MAEEKSAQSPRKSVRGRVSIVGLFFMLAGRFP
jgi:hypothetical protein